MYAMQYPIALPADYDMGIIRKRVESASPTLDDRAGLGFKAYLIREHGVSGSPVNEYAPFYVWNETTAMAHFLFEGGGFQNIIRTFGRVPVRHWLGAAVLAGPAYGERAAVATRRTALLSGDEGLMDGEVDALRAWAARPGVHTTVLAVDPQTWQSVRLTLWREGAEPDDAADADRYEVLHVSAPELDRLL